MVPEKKAWITTAIGLLIFLPLGMIPFSSMYKEISVAGGTAAWPDFSEVHAHYSLNGEWLLFPDNSKEGVLQEVPAVAWERGTGMYTLELYFPESAAGIPMEMYSRNIGSSGDVLFNGELIGSFGVYGESSEEAVPSAQSKVLLFTPEAGWNTIDILVSNFTHPRAGLWERIIVSRSPILSLKLQRRQAFSLLMFGNLLFIALFHLIMALLNKQRDYFAFFSGGVLFAALGNIVQAPYAVYLLLPDIDYILLKRSQFFLYYLAAAFIFKAFQREQKPMKISVFFDLFMAFCLVLVLLTALLPFSTAYSMSAPFYPLAVAVSFIMVGYRFKLLFSYTSHGSLQWAVPRLIGDFILIFGIIHDAHATLTGRYDVITMPLAIYAYSVLYTLLLAASFVKALKRNERAKQEIILSADRERQRLRSDIHDGVGQLTHGLEYLAAGALQKYPGQAELIKIRDAAKEINLDIRRILNGLSPAVLEHAGLEGAITELADEIRLNGKTTVTVEMDTAADVGSSQIGLQIYYIVKESISNALRHADPDIIRIVLDRTDSRIRVFVENDGVPTRPKADLCRRGHGIDIIRYRVNLLEGVLYAGSQGGGKFCVAAEIPVRKSRTKSSKRDYTACKEFL